MRRAADAASQAAGSSSDITARLSAQWVSERLGHANIKITLDTYAHVLPTMQKAAADKMQKLLG